jgi:hypothetical protein
MFTVRDLKRSKIECVALKERKSNIYNITQRISTVQVG